MRPEGRYSNLSDTVVSSECESQAATPTVVASQPEAAAAAPATVVADGVPPPVAPLGGLDRLLHEPARLAIAGLLAPVDRMDFLDLLARSGLSKGNLSAHLARLERSGYLAIEKAFRGRIPRTSCRLSPEGREALRQYRARLTRLLESFPE